jgi:hypothetical protein
MGMRKRREAREEGVVTMRRHERERREKRRGV